MALTDRQQFFVAEYLVDLNATQAAIRAGYSEKTAASQGERLLRNVEIRAAVDVGRNAKVARAELSQDWVLGRLRREATRLAEGASHSARVSALKLLGQHLGMFRDKPDLPGGGVDLPPEERSSEELNRLIDEDNARRGRAGDPPATGSPE